MNEQSKSQINGVNVPYDKSTTELIEKLNLSTSDFCVVCEALSQKNDDLSYLTLLNVAKSSDHFKRRLGLECLGKHKLFSNNIDIVLPYLDDTSPFVVRTAIEIVKNYSLIKAHDKIISLIKSKDELTREIAVSALAYIGNENDFDLLICLYSDINENVKKLSIDLIFIVATIRNWRRGYDILKCSKYEKARLTACKLLDKFGLEIKNQEMMIFLQDKNGHIRKYAKNALNRIK